MTLRKAIKLARGKRPGMRAKFVLSLGGIAVVLLLSSVITIMEYRRMSSYVSDLIAKDIESINVARRLGDVSNEYNLDILAAIGDGKATELPDFDASVFMARCDSLSAAFSSTSSLADSVKYSYSAYMLTSLELGTVLRSDFIDTRAWYFERLQPKYRRLRSDIDALSSAIYEDLKANSVDFDSGLYRSLIPGVVATGVGLLLVLMCLVYLLTYFVNPAYRMLSGLDSYRSYGKNYTVKFDGDDQLSRINEGIADLAGENRTLRRRIAALKHESEGGK